MKGGICGAKRDREPRPLERRDARTVDRVVMGRQMRCSTEWEWVLGGEKARANDDACTALRCDEKKSLRCCFQGAKCDGGGGGGRVDARWARRRAGERARDGQM